jgi:hypothetical protein
MPFDILALAAVTDELQATVGGQVQRIIQPSAASIALAVYAHRTQRWLLTSVDARYARVHLSTQRLAKAFATPSSFVMLLRKHLEGRRIGAIDQTPHERVLTVRFRGHDQEILLIAELMGKHSNLILLDANRRILGAIKAVPPSQSRVRPVLPGREYAAPPVRGRDERLYPGGDRLDPVAGPEHCTQLLDALPSGTPAIEALLGLLPGCSPFMAGQMVRRAGVSAAKPQHGAWGESLVRAAQTLYQLPRTQSWEPCTFTSESGRKDFAPYLPLGVDQIAAAPSLSEAI